MPRALESGGWKCSWHLIWQFQIIRIQNKYNAPTLGKVPNVCLSAPEKLGFTLKKNLCVQHSGEKVYQVQWLGNLCYKSTQHSWKGVFQHFPFSLHSTMVLWELYRDEVGRRIWKLLSCYRKYFLATEDIVRNCLIFLDTSNYHPDTQSYFRSTRAKALDFFSSQTRPRFTIASENAKCSRI